MKGTLKKRYAWRLLAAALLLAGLMLAACGNDAKATTMKLAGTQGSVDVADGDNEAVELIENLPLYSGYQVGTQADSFAWINLDDTKLTKMDTDSAVHIQKSGTDLEVIVDRGSLFFHVTEPLSDETLSIRTSTMVVGIRGTMGWVDASDPERMKVFLLEGTVEVYAGGEEESGTALQTAAVSAGQMAEVTLTDGKAEIAVNGFRKDEIPAFVLEETMKLDAALQEEIYASLKQEESESQGTEDTVEPKPAGTEEPEDTEDFGAEEPEASDDDTDETGGESTGQWLEQSDSGGMMPAIYSFEWSEGTLTMEFYHVVADSRDTREDIVPESCIWAKNGGYAEHPDTGEMTLFVEDIVSYEEFKAWYDARVASFMAEHPGEDIPYGIGYSRQGDTIVAVYIYDR